MPAHWETRPCHSEGSSLLPQRGLCKSKEPPGLAAQGTDEFHSQGPAPGEGSCVE